MYEFACLSEAVVYNSDCVLNVDGDIHTCERVRGKSHCCTSVHTMHIYMKCHSTITVHHTFLYRWRNCFTASSAVLLSSSCIWQLHRSVSFPPRKLIYQSNFSFLVEKSKHMQSFTVLVVTKNHVLCVCNH